MVFHAVGAEKRASIPEHPRQRAARSGALLLAALLAGTAVVLGAAFAPSARLAVAQQLDPLLSLASHTGSPRQQRPLPMRPLPAARLSLLNVVRKEPLSVVPFDPFGRPVPEAFAQIGYLFRSARGAETSIDPRLVELLMTIARHYPERQLSLISGHREPGGRTSNKSYHVRGMAADIAVAGIPSHELAKAARKLGARGVGRYPRFVHVDVRTVPYKWAGW